MADDGARDDERGAPDEGPSLAPVPARPRVPWARRSAAGKAAGTPEPARGVAAEASEDVSEADAPLGRHVPGERSRRPRVRAFLSVVADRLVQVAPRVPVRDLETLRRQFPGLGPEEIADKLVSAALKGSATVGAGVGAAAMMPVPPAMPTELAAEIVGVASVELKLIAELHEVYGRPAPGNLQQRTAAYLRAWTSERRIDVTKPESLNAALGVQMRRELRQRLLKRTLRNLPSLTPFMVGAAVGAVMNRRDTARLAESVRADLRRDAAPWPELPSRHEPPAPGGPPAPRDV